MTAPALSLLAPSEVEDILHDSLFDRDAGDAVRRWLPYVLLGALGGSEWVAQQISLAALLSDRDAVLLRLMEKRAQALQAVQATTRARVRQAILDAAHSEATPATVAEAVRETFSKMAATRAPLIGLQEAGGAWEAGATREMALRIVPARIWITQRDIRVRVLHAVIDGQCRKPDEAFQTPDGHLAMYPRDPEAEPDMTLGCRCYTAPLARGCETQARHLASEPQRRAYWKAANARMGAVERPMVREIRRTFRAQRERVLVALAHRLR